MQQRLDVGNRANAAGTDNPNPNSKSNPNPNDNLKNKQQ